MIQVRTHTFPAFLGAAAIAVATAAPARAQTPLLDVPYIEQSEALCGGAAAAMVMRYWGARSVYAESFAPLVDHGAGGIRGADLLSELAARGWDARSFRGEAALIEARLASRQPVVALIEDRPGAFHYVVVVGWLGDRVIFHDPARNPYRVMRAAQFERAWAKSDRWTMLLLPGADSSSRVLSERPAVTAGEPPPVSPCDGLMQTGARAAAEGDAGAALDAFESAAALCPALSAAHRESAGLHALAGRWPEAERDARLAVARDAADAHAWRILATAAFVRGNTAAALAAWNAVREPAIDLVQVHGLTRTRHAAVTRFLALEPGSVLTSARLARIQKQIAELPAVAVGTANYTPLGEGRAAVEAVVVERPLWPIHRTALVTAGLRALTDREASAQITSPTGGGEVIGASWRWWQARPRWTAWYAAPSRAGLLRADVFGEEQAYGAPAGGAIESIKGGTISLSNWTTSMLRWEAVAGLVAIDSSAAVRAGGSLDQRLVGDRIALRTGIDLLAGSGLSARARASMVIRTRPEHDGTVLVSTAGIERVTAGAPLAWLAGAGTGDAREPLLRAHPLLADGRISGEVFGRELVHGSLELRRWSGRVLRVVRIAPAVFVDAARAGRRLEPGPAWHADAGFGVRVALPGSGVLRIDAARGLRDGAMALSFGWRTE